MGPQGQWPALGGPAGIKPDTERSQLRPQQGHWSAAKPCAPPSVAAATPKLSKQTLSVKMWAGSGKVLGTWSGYGAGSGEVLGTWRDLLGPRFTKSMNFPWLCLDSPGWPGCSEDSLLPESHRPFSCHPQPLSGGVSQSCPFKATGTSILWQAAAKHEQADSAVSRSNLGT